MSSPFNLFAEDMRSTVMEEMGNPNESILEREVERRWNSLSQAEKNDYEEQYNNSVSKSTSSQSIPPKAKRASKKSKTKTEITPKKPLTPWIYFTMETRPIIHNEMPELNNNDILPEISLRWKAMTEEEKLPYVEKALKDKERFAEETKYYEMGP
ncbi:hypothetical protein P9112_000330 [Eukaryota sp. TZLM1-RC]